MAETKTPPTSSKPNGKHVTWMQLCGILGAFFAFIVGILITGINKMESRQKTRLDRIEARMMHYETELRNDMRTFQEMTSALLASEYGLDPPQENEDETIRNP